MALSATDRLETGNNNRVTTEPQQAKATKPQAVSTSR